MALVHRRENPLKLTWSIAQTKETRHKLPKLEPKQTQAIDYNELQSICSIPGLRDRENAQSTDEAHKVFMKSYHRMFAQPPKRIGFPVHLEKAETGKKSTAASYTSHKATGKVSDEEKNKPKNPMKITSHDIRDYVKLYHRERKSEDPDGIRAENIRTLRRLLRKLPFERTPADNDKIFSILKTFPVLRDITTHAVLKELCVLAQIEIWKNKDFTVFGNLGLYMILRGAVEPLTKPYVNPTTEPMVFRSPTPVMEDSGYTLSVGDTFGTLIRIPGHGVGSKALSVLTLEPNCEFLKISTSDYSRVIEQIKQREKMEKLNLVLSCPQYKLWPRQPLNQVASLIEWLSYPPNTVLVSEGYKSPFIAFIKAGECHVLKQVEVLVTQRNQKTVYPSLFGEEEDDSCSNGMKKKKGKPERQSKQVVMGKLGPSDSFGEISVLRDECITCSIITATELELGIIKPERIHELDEVTLQLFEQSNKPTFGGLTKEIIQEEYIQQELKREWNEFKHSVVVDVINSSGIRPGYGKWKK